jgi:hypothetical protein
LHLTSTKAGTSAKQLEHMVLTVHGNPDTIQENITPKKKKKVTETHIKTALSPINPFRLHNEAAKSKRMNMICWYYNHSV